MSQKSVSEEQLARENARLRGDLLTIGTRVNHDLRTPLGGILNTAELLKEIFIEHGISAEPLNALFCSVDEMMRTIKSVSLFAKASANPLPMKKIKMSDAVYSAWQRVERQILKRGAAVQLAESWPDVNGVTDWLEFVWWNFLSNALQYGGKIIEAGWREENGNQKFFVRDDGDGVAPERRSKLFQPFEELHQPGAGRGLGLSITRRLVELQGGSCGYEVEDKTCFYFTMPVAKT